MNKTYKAKKYAVISSIAEHFPADAVDRIKASAVRFKLRGIPELNWDLSDYCENHPSTWIKTKACEIEKRFQTCDFEDRGSSESIAKLRSPNSSRGLSVVINLDPIVLRHYNLPGNWIIRKDSLHLAPALLVETHRLATRLARDYSTSREKPARERRLKIATLKSLSRLAGFKTRAVAVQVGENFEPEDDDTYCSRSYVSLGKRVSGGEVELNYIADRRGDGHLKLEITLKTESPALRGKNCHKLTRLLAAIRGLDK